MYNRIAFKIDQNSEFFPFLQPCIFYKSQLTVPPASSSKLSIFPFYIPPKGYSKCSVHSAHRVSFWFYGEKRLVAIFMTILFFSFSIFTTICFLVTPNTSFAFSKLTLFSISYAPKDRSKCSILSGCRGTAFESGLRGNAFLFYHHLSFLWSQLTLPPPPTNWPSAQFPTPPN